MTATPTSLVGGPPWIPVSWTAVCPFPRASSQRFTGTVRAKAIASEKASEPQKRISPSPAWMASGTSRMTALSTTSIVPIESVSDASAIGTTAPRASPAFSSGRLVSE